MKIKIKIIKIKIKMKRKKINESRKGRESKGYCSACSWLMTREVTARQPSIGSWALS